MSGSPTVPLVSRRHPCWWNSKSIFADSGFTIVGANADRYLELPYDDQTRFDYVERLGIRFTNGHLTEDMQNSYGGVSVFPTMFFVNRNGTIVRHFVNFQEKEALEEAVRATLQ